MSKPVIVAAIIVIKSLIMLLMLFSSVVALAVSPAVLLPPARLADLGLYWCAVRKCRFHGPDYIGSSGPYYLHTSFFIDWNLCYGSVAPIDMNSLANLNAVVDEHGEPTSWPSEGWDPPVATICTAVLPDTRLHFHPSNATRQDWDWPDNPMILASQYSAEEQEIECKPNIMQVEALDGGSSTGLRQYNGILTAANVPAMATAQNLWPGVLNAAAIRQNMGLEINSSSSYSPSFYGGLGGGAGSSAWINGGYGQGGSTSVNNYLGIGEARTALEQRHGHLLGLPNINHRRIHDILKRGMYASGSGGTPDFSARIGLNLGGRTYFSTEDNSTLARFGKRFQPNPPTMHVPLCQAEGCKADLSMAKHYHRRHKVCEYHSKAATVMINGSNGNNTQRFCQQCSRFHGLSEFDEGKRSCRKRLADHNRRRRKPQPSPATAAATPIASFNADSTMKLNDEASKEDKGGRSEEQAHEQHKEAAMAATSSEPTPSLLSPMSLAPSVMLTLQNGNREMQATATSEENEKEPAYESQPYLLNGPSLSLSNIAAAGAAGGGSTPSHQQGQSSPQNFGDVEMSVPWLRTHHLGSSTRMALMQESMGRSASLQAKKESMSNSTSHGNGQYMNEHGRLLAEHLQSLQSQVESSTDHYHHQMHGKTENWILESTNVQEGQTVLSLLETASTSKKDHQHHQNVFNAEAQENAGSRPPIGFLQQHVGHLNSPGDMNHETSDDAAISLHRMQVLRPLDESLHTTADFMKDGFV